MVVHSFVTHQGSLVPIEVELVLVPGLPQIHFLGLPDQHIRESTERIKCALKKQGFEFPKSQQVLVNLRPSYVKKTSRGAELAVAAAFLWETGQVPLPLQQSNLFLYGEIDLHGNIYEPDDLFRSFQFDDQTLILTGVGQGEHSSSFRKLMIKDLKSLTCPEIIEAKKYYKVSKVNYPEKMSVKQSFAELIACFNLAPFHLLLAGPAGSGKSTLAKNLIHFLTPPTEKQIRELSELNKSAMSWWPFISPHPSITAKAFLGNERMQGEVFRAHQGILMLDELLEFKPEALEVLRAPLDGHELLVSRVDQRVQKVSKFTCVATTNLCPCGDWLPDQRKEFDCSLPERKCVQYRQKLSGPMLDRFEVLFFTDCKQEKFISFQDIMEKSEVIKRDFVATPQADATKGLPDEIQNSLQGVSSRRRKAFFKLLHAVNAVHQNQKTFPEICKIAYDLTIGNFQKLQPQPLGMMIAGNSLNRT